MTNTDISKMSFEEALSQLEDMIRKMESGEVKLEDSVTMYERGMALKKLCETKLKEARLRVEKITLSPTGEAQTSPLDAE